MRGKFITFEGCDASGKSTNVPAAAAHLRSLGYEVHVTREPGGTPVGERLRELVLHHRMASKTELLVFAAARAEHMADVILPMLEQGAVVLSDRFSDSSFAFQGVARGMREDTLALEKFVLNGFEPDYTLFFDVSLEESARRLRLRSGKQDRLDLEEDNFKKLVYQGYQERFTQNPHRMVRIDSHQSMEGVASQVIDWINRTFTKTT